MEENNVEHMWKQMELAVVESGSVRVGGKKPKSVWWNDQVKAMVKRKKAAWKKVLGAKDEDAK